MLEKYRWGIEEERGYCRNGQREKMHHLIVGKIEGKDVDHVNRNKLDNRKKNLRHVTRAQNIWNRKVEGVHRHSETNRWVVQIMTNGKRLHIGCFGTKKEALKVRKDAEGKLRVYQIK